MPSLVPSALTQLLASASVVGVSGSRRPGPASLAALHQVLPLIAGWVFTGCASGIDQAARSGTPAARLRVFRAASRQAWALAGRSAACVRAVAATSGVWLSFPDAPCPAGLAPSRSASACFSGFGSGSWASLALARGFGLPAIVFLPASLVPPPGFGLLAVGRTAGGCWFLGSGSGPLSLFAS